MTVDCDVDALNEAVSAALRAPLSSNVLHKIRPHEISEDSLPIAPRWKEMHLLATGGDGFDDLSEASAGLDDGKLSLGLRWLKEAFVRTEIPPESKGQHRRLRILAVKGRVALEEERKAVKKELRKFDKDFEDHMGRPPARAEKEPLRPLYTYYRKVKAVTEKISTKPSRASSDTSGSIVPSRSQRETDADIDASVATDNEFTTAPVDPKTRLHSLVQEAEECRQILQEYQQAFMARTGRRCTYHTDIVPIRKEYARYKELKQQVKCLTDTIRVQEAANGSSL